MPVFQHLQSLMPPDISPCALYLTSPLARVASKQTKQPKLMCSQPSGAQDGLHGSKGTPATYHHVGQHGLPKQAHVIDSQGRISGLRQACASWAALR